MTSIMSHITTVDIIFVLIALIFCIKAAIKGFIDEVFGVGAFILCAFGSIKLSPLLEPYLSDVMNVYLAKVLAFVIIFVGLFLIVKIIQLALKSIFSGTIFTSLDHGLGFIFGIVEAILFICIIIMILQVLQPWIDTQKIRDDSFFCRIFQFLLNHPDAPQELKEIGNNV